MRFSHIPYPTPPTFSQRDIDYINEHSTLKPFYTYPVEWSSFQQAIKQKAYPDANRQVLVNVLEKQYQLPGIQTSEKVLDNIKALSANTTFTVVTGHQPNLATGPLYFIYKIISIINLCEKLNQLHPDHRFVPVYWMGSEDHDFEEINHFHLFGKTLTWEEEAGGSVGHLPTENIKPVLEELKGLMGQSTFAEKAYELIETAYTLQPDLEKATFWLVNELFKEYGLVVLIPSVPKMKKLFASVMEAELIQQPSVALVEETHRRLAELGYKAQATPRQINLFYLTPGSRKRIEIQGDEYVVLDSDIRFSKEEILFELGEHPERFSPNVVLRPLFQETILPNLAYVGGGGELAYWLERKTLFEHFNLPFPMLIRRASVLWIDKGTAKKMSKLEISIDDLFKNTDQLIKEYALKNASGTLSLDHQKRLLLQQFEEITHIAEQIDPTLLKSVKGEQAKVEKAINTLENKLIRAEKRKHEQANNQIKAVKDKVFPFGSLQERKTNFLTIYIKHGPPFMKYLKDHIDPMKKQLLVVEEG